MQVPGSEGARVHPFGRQARPGEAIGAVYAALPRLVASGRLDIGRDSRTRHCSIDSRTHVLYSNSATAASPHRLEVTRAYMCFQAKHNPGKSLGN